VPFQSNRAREGSQGGTSRGGTGPKHTFTEVNIGFMVTSMKGSSARMDPLPFFLPLVDGAHTAYSSAANTAKKYTMENTTTITSSHVTSCVWTAAGTEGVHIRK
jgi:hypothetical protein